MSHTKKLRYIILSTLLIIVYYLVSFFSGLVTDSNSYHILRGLITAGLGIIFVLFGKTAVGQKMTSKIEKILRILFGFTGFYLCLYGFGVTLFATTCAYDGRHKTLSPTSDWTPDIMVRNTRVYMDYIGDQGAVGSINIGVFQEVPLFDSSSLFRVKLVCEAEDSNDDLKFRLVDTQHIECDLKSGRKKFSLPF